MKQAETLGVDPDLLKKGAGVLRALNNKVRQDLIKTIHKHERTNVSHLYRKLHMEQSVVSQHLRILRDARFVNTERAGKEIYYSLNYERFREIDKLTKELLK